MVSESHKWFTGIQNCIRMVYARTRADPALSDCFDEETLRTFGLSPDCKVVSRDVSFALSHVQSPVVPVTEDFDIVIDSQKVLKDAKYRYTRRNRGITVSATGTMVPGTHEVFHIDRLQLFLLDHELYVPHELVLDTGPIYQRYGASPETYPKIELIDPVVRFYGWKKGSLIKITLSGVAEAKYRLVA